jgi:zinc-ribbon domain
VIRQPRGCSKCGCENPAGNNFCARCGTALGARYAKCCAENSLTSNFCGKRGAALTALIGTPISERATILSREVIGERRHLTVLFCDLVGSTAIAAQLDPEEWRDTVAGHHSATAEAIMRFGGHVAKYLADGRWLTSVLCAAVTGLIPARKLTIYSDSHEAPPRRRTCDGRQLSPIMRGTAVSLGEVGAVCSEAGSRGPVFFF